MQNEINTVKETISMLQCPFRKNDIHRKLLHLMHFFIYLKLSYIFIYIWIFCSHISPKDYTIYSNSIVYCLYWCHQRYDICSHNLLYFCTALPFDKECFKKDHVCSITHILYLLLDIYALHNLIKVKRALASSHREHSVCQKKCTRFIRFQICSYLYSFLLQIPCSKPGKILQYSRYQTWTKIS